MTKELRDSLEKLRIVSPKLNKATDEAATMVTAVETFLNDQCSIGIPAEKWAWGSPTSRLYLAYKRVSGKFRIAIAEHEPEYEEDVDGERRKVLDENGHQNWTEVRSIPWSEGSRTEKLRTFSCLPDLLRVIVEEAENAVKTTEKTAATVRELMEALNQPAAASKAIKIELKLLLMHGNLDDPDWDMITSYLDRETGQIEVLWHNDEQADSMGAKDNRKTRKMIESNPHRYLQIDLFCHYNPLDEHVSDAAKDAATEWLSKHGIKAELE